MKNFICFLVIFLVAVVFTFCKELEFELLGTDFTGVFHKENKVFIYGKYGIINYSDDLGNNWKQTYVGKNSDVLKIISVDDMVYALTTDRIFIWNDPLKKWEESSINWERNFVDFCTDGSQIFIITENEILSVDKELKSDLKLIYSFDIFTKFTEMTIWQNYLLIIDANISIFKFNTLTNIPEDTLFTGFSTQKIEKLKIRDSTIYVLLVSADHSPSRELDYQVIRHSVLFSKDFGKTWKIFAKDLPITKDYLIEDTDARTLSPKLLKNYRGYTVSFVRSDSNGLFEENELIAPNTWIPYFNFIEDANTFRINSIQKINKHTIIAVGNNKTILISTDDGKNWAFSSYFRPIYSLFVDNAMINEIVEVGRDTIAVLSDYRPYFFTSYDGGATFKTLGIDTNFRNLLSNFTSPITPPNGKLGYFSFHKDKNHKLTGKIKVVEINFTNNEYATNDYLIQPYQTFRWDSVDAVFISDPIYLQKKIYVLARLLRNGYSNNTLIFVFDNQLKLIDTLFLPRAISNFAYDENYLYTTSSDSVMTYILRVPSLKSDWEIVASIPQVSYSKPSERVYLGLSKVYKNYFIFVKTVIKGSQWGWYLLFLEKSTGNLDSVYFKEQPKIFAHDDHLLITFLNRNWIRKYQNLPIDTATYIEYLLPDISGSTINNIFRLENQNYISLEKIYSSSYDNIYEGNYGILKEKFSEPNVVTELVRPFLFCYLLYPNPTSNYIDLKLCWDEGFSLENVNFTFLNLLGQKIEIPHTLLGQFDRNCGTIRFFLNNVFSPDIYFINVKLQNNEWTLPFVFTK